MLTLISRVVCEERVNIFVDEVLLILGLIFLVLFVSFVEHSLSERKIIIPKQILTNFVRIWIARQGL